MAMNTTLRSAMTQYLRKQAQGKPSVYYNDLYILERFVHWCGDVQVRHVTAEHLTRYFFGPGRIGNSKEPWNGLLYGGAGTYAISKTTARHYRSRLTVFFTFCRDNGWLKINPLVNIPRFPRQPKPRRRVTTLDLFRLLDAAANPRDRAALAFAMNTGVRAGELCSVRIGDLDLEAGSVALTISKTNVYDDDMAVSAELDREMRCWLTFYALSAGELQPDWFLFPAMDRPAFQWITHEDGSRRCISGPQALKPTARFTHPEKAVQRALVGLGMDPKGQGLHLLRRSVARALYDHARAEGEDAIRVVQSFLHHERQSTSEMYIGIEREKEARNALLRGKPFLGSLVTDENVVSLDSRRAE